MKKIMGFKKEEVCITTAAVLVLLTIMAISEYM